MDQEKDAVIEKLVGELAAAQIMLAQMIVRIECIAYRPPPKTIARNWQKTAKEYLSDEWSSGAQALETYILVKYPKRVVVIGEFLFPYAEKYRIGRKKMHHLTGSKSPDITKARQVLLAKYHPRIEIPANVKPQPEPETHGATRGAYETFKHLLGRGKQYLMGAQNGSKT